MNISVGSGDGMFSHRILDVDMSEVKRVLALIKGGDVISFAGGVPSKEVFPLKELKDAFLEVAEIPDAFQYGSTLGFEGLREELLKHLKESQGIHAKLEEIMITHGSQQGIDIVGRAFVDPRDMIVVEAPTYFVALNTFQIYGSRFLQVGLDEEGLKTEELETLLRKLRADGKKIKLLYTIPTFQNPSGVTMSEERRKHLVELAEDFDFIIVEDNPYGELRYSGSPVKAIKHFDKSGRVINLGTFSKIFVPGFRLAWLIASEELMEKLEVGKLTTDVCSNTVGQYVTWTFMRKGLLKKHIQRLIEFYKPKRDAMLEALDEFMPENVNWTRPEGGMFIWLTIDGNVDTKEILEEAVKRGVAYVPGKVFYALKGGENQMRLNFTFESVERIREGVKKLAELIAGF
ncbi:MULTISPECIES: PLP-dependent aminotransferase family protein [unclassified Thermococcus]|uniref:aminotransferase-like domain-containing protein n=1 Tax=unclassified Thermococcus TaxID=2627626 RepID=UPI001F0D659F|nr:MULTISPECIES: PLP-dependent aminotransferase family protein [unclassified Thermococcus]